MRSALADAPVGRAEVAKAVAARRARGGVEVVLEHQPLRLGHGRLGLVHVRALGEREQLGDRAAGCALGLGARRAAASAGIPAARGVDAEPLAHARGTPGRARVSSGSPSTSCTYWCAISCLSTSTHHAPRAVDDEARAQLDAPLAREPLAELVRAVGERQRRRAQAALEVGFVELAPGAEQLPQQRRLERRREGVVAHRDQCRRRAIVTPQNLGRDLATK